MTSPNRAHDSFKGSSGRAFVGICPPQQGATPPSPTDVRGQSGPSPTDAGCNTSGGQAALRTAARRRHVAGRGSNGGPQHPHRLLRRGAVGRATGRPRRPPPRRSVRVDDVRPFIDNNPRLSPKRPLRSARGSQGVDGEVMPVLRSQLVGPQGGISRAAPQGWTWHHAAEPGLMRLVPGIQHTAPGALQRLFHPGRIGRFSIWGTG